MGSLKHCLSLHPLESYDEKRVRSILKEYRAEGYPGGEANQKAISDYISELGTVRAGIMDQLKELGYGAAPEDKGKNFPLRKQFEALVKEGKVSREAADAIYDVVENLAPKYGVDIDSVVYDNGNQTADPRTVEGRLMAKVVYGQTQEAIDEAIKQGKVFEVRAFHDYEDVPGRGIGQGRSKITVLRHADADDIYHEFAHAADSQRQAVRREQEDREAFARRVAKEILAGDFSTLDAGGPNTTKETRDYSVKGFREMNKKGQPVWQTKFSKDALRAGFTDKEVDATLSNIDALASIFESRPDLLPLEAAIGKDGKVMPAIYNNADFIKTLDVNRICRRTRQYYATIKTVETRLGKLLTPDDMLSLAQYMRKDGNIPFCIFCYVEAGRRAARRNAIAFIRGGVKESPKGLREIIPIRDDLLRKAGLSSDEFEKIVTSPREIQKWQANSRDFRGLYALYHKYVLGAKGTAIVQNGEYNHQILGWSKEQIEAFNDRAGLRTFSSTDLDPTQLVDILQAFADATVKKLAMHGYTKDAFTSFIFGNTGMKINNSIAANGRDSLSPDVVNGMDWGLVEKIRKEFPDSGSMFVAKNHPQVRLSMLDDFIDMVIPHHAANWEGGKYKSFDLEDMAYAQSDTWRDKTKAPKDSDGTALTPKKVFHEKLLFQYWLKQAKNDERKAVEMYWDFCDRNNVVPKWTEQTTGTGKGKKTFMQMIGFTSREEMIGSGYAKLIKDYARTETPQTPVDNSKIDMKAARDYLNEFIGNEGFTLSDKRNPMVKKFLKDKRAEKIPTFENMESNLADMPINARQTLESVSQVHAEALKEFSTKAVDADEQAPSIILRGAGDYVDDRGDIRVSESRKEKLIKQRFGEIQPTEEGIPELVLTGGLPGAGKSSSLRAMGVDKTDYVHADSDKIKSDAGYEDQAGAFHEESSDINKVVAERAIEGNYPVIYDSLLSSFKQADKLIGQTLAKNGVVKIAFQNIDFETSRTRSGIRLEKGETNRKIPQSASLKGHNYSLPTFVALWEKYENNPNVHFVLYDNNIDGQKAKMVFVKAGNQFVVADQPLFDDLMNVEYTSSGGKYERTQRLTEEEIGQAESRSRERVVRALRQGGEVSRRSTKGTAPQTGEVDRSNPSRSPGQGEQTDFSTKAAPAFYSQLQRTLENKLTEMPGKAQSVIPWLQKQGVKPMELEEMGVDAWLKANQKDGKIDKAAFVDWVKENQVQIEEVTKGAPDLTDAEVSQKYHEVYGDNAAFYGEHPTSEDYQEMREALREAEDEDSLPKFGSYILPGGTNYREILFTLPATKAKENAIDHMSLDQLQQFYQNFDRNGYDTLEDDETSDASTLRAIIKENMPLWRSENGESMDRYLDVRLNDTTFTSSHWSEPNVLAHVRLQDFTDKDGAKVLLVEEVQSDWHQAGKKEGYQGKEVKDLWTIVPNEKQEGTFLVQLNGETMQTNELRRDDIVFINRQRAEDYVELMKSRPGSQSILVPNAPLKQNWHEYLLKRMIRFAAENGYDSLAWTPGEIQADRYDLSKQVDRVEYYQGSEVLRGYKDGRVVIDEGTVTPSKLESYVGKEAAQKLLSETSAAPSLNVDTITDKAGLEKAIMGKDDQFWAIQTDEEGDSMFAGLPYSGVQCSGFACRLKQMFGDRAQIYGFSTEENPGTLIEELTDGHDFAVVDDRYLVDPWLVEIESGNFNTHKDGKVSAGSGVFDLQNAADKKAATLIYGDRKNWSRMKDIENEALMSGDVGRPSVLEGEDLKVGGKGMKVFYDQLIPGFLNKYVKQWGAKVGETEIITDEGYKDIQPGPYRDYVESQATTVPSIPITSAMRDAVLNQGQPMYSTKAVEPDTLSSMSSSEGPDKTTKTNPAVKPEGGKWKVNFNDYGYHYTANEFTTFDNEKGSKGWTTDFGKDVVFPKDAHFFFLGDHPADNLPQTRNRKKLKVDLGASKLLDLTKPMSGEEFSSIADWMIEKFTKEATTGEAGSRVSGKYVDGLRRARKEGVTPQQLFDFVSNESFYLRGETFRRLMDDLGYDAVKFEGNSSGTSTLEPERGKGDGKTYTIVAVLNPDQIEILPNPSRSPGKGEQKDYSVKPTKDFDLDDFMSALAKKNPKFADDLKDVFAEIDAMNIDPEPLGTEQKEIPDPKESTTKTRTWFGRETAAIFRTIAKSTPANMGHNSFLENVLKSPEWYEHPVFKNIIRLFTMDREKIYHTTLLDLITVDDKNVITETDKLRKKNPAAYKELLFAIDFGDTKWKRGDKSMERLRDPSISDIARNVVVANQVKKYEEYLTEKRGVSPEAIRVWKLHRASYDKALDLMTAQLRELIKQMGEGETTTQTKTTLKELKEALASMNEWRGFYAPRLRERGNWVVQAERKSGDKTERYRNHAGKLGAERLAEKLKTQGWKDVTVTEASKLPESVYQNLKAVDIAKAIKEASQGMKGEAAAIFNEDLIESVSNLIKSRGFRGSMIHRGQGDVVQGYMTDPLERYTTYVNNQAGGFSKGQVAQKAMQLLLGERDSDGKVVGGISASKEPRVYTTAERYMAEQLRNLDFTDKMVGLAKSVATFKYLGFNPRSMLVNLTALATTVPAALHQYVLGNKGSMTKVLGTLTKASGDTVLIMGKKKLKNADEQWFVDRVQKEGYTDAQLARDAMGKIDKIHKRLWSKAMTAAMWMFGKTEEFNRTTTMLAGFRLAIAAGKTREQAYEVAIDASNKAHGLYGRSTLPAWAQGGNPAAKVGQALYVYGKFGHNYLQMMYDLGFKKHDIRAFLWGFLSPLVLAGGSAWPLKDAMFGIIDMIMKLLGYGKQPTEKIIYDAIRRRFGKKAELGARHGVTGLAGIDISESLSVGVGVPKKMWELTGAIGGVYDDIEKAAHFMKTGQPGRALEKALPTGIANPFRAVREGTHGVTSEKGRALIDEDTGTRLQLSPSQMALRAGGFRPSGQAVLTERRQEHRDLVKTFDDKRDAIYEEARAYFADPRRDTRGMTKLMQRQMEYNQSIRDADLVGLVPFMKYASIRNQAKNIRSTSKAERLRLARDHADEE